MLSVTVIAKNEEKYLPACIASAKLLTDDIAVVIDASSTDNSEKICKDLGCTTVVKKFDNFAAQKNYVVSLAKRDWILSMDADETLSPDLIKEITIVLSAPKYQAYSIPRINSIFGKQLKHTNWSPEDDRHVWLFDRKTAHWEGNVHEHVVGFSSAGRLQNPKIHQNYHTVEQFLVQLNQYTTLEAQNNHFNLLFLFIYPPWKFFRHYVLKLGFLDGLHGLYLSYLMAIYGLTVCLKSWSKNISSG